MVSYQLSMGACTLLIEEVFSLFASLDEQTILPISSRSLLVNVSKRGVSIEQINVCHGPDICSIYDPFKTPTMTPLKHPNALSKGNVYIFIY